MKLTIRLHGVLTRLLEGRDSLTVEMAPGSAVQDLLAQLGVDPRELWFHVVNGEMATPDTTLHEGDIVDLVPPIGGGMDRPAARGTGASGSKSERRFA